MNVTVTYERDRRKSRDFDNVEAVHSHTNGSTLLDFGGDEIELSGVECIHIRDGSE